VNIPNWWQFLLLSLAAWRVFQLLAFDDILARPRRYVMRWEDFYSCVYCFGFYCALAFWGFWELWPHGTLVVSVPLALSTALISVAKFLSSE
jgi:hypothetical protein